MQCAFLIFFTIVTVALTAYVITLLRSTRSRISYTISLLGICVTIVIALLTDQILPICTMTESEIPTLLVSPTLALTATKTPIPTSATPTPTPTSLLPTSITVLLPTATVTPTPTSSATETSTSLSVASPTDTVTMLPTLLPTKTATLISPTATATAFSTPTPMITPTSTTTATATEIVNEVRIRVEGIGAAPDTQKNEALREQLAIQAAKVNAKAQLAEWIDGAEIESITIIDQGVLTTELIRQTIKAKVPPSTVIEQFYDRESGTAHVVLETAIDRKSVV